MTTTPPQIVKFSRITRDSEIIIFRTKDSLPFFDQKNPEHDYYESMESILERAIQSYIKMFPFVSRDQMNDSCFVWMGVLLGVYRDANVFSAARFAGEGEHSLERVLVYDPSFHHNQKIVPYLKDMTHLLTIKCKFPPLSNNKSLSRTASPIRVDDLLSSSQMGEAACGLIAIKNEEEVCVDFPSYSSSFSGHRARKAKKHVKYSM